VALAQRGDSCSRCGGHQLQVTGGDELRVKDIELA
jgi:hydrogenase nickel incorporation protein HypA/HybF